MSQYTVLGRDAINQKGWWQAHRWLVLRRISQIAILLLFLLGPWAGIWILKGNLTSSLLFNTIPLTDPMTFIQLLAAGFWGVAGACGAGCCHCARFLHVGRGTRILLLGVPGQSGD